MLKNILMLITFLIKHTLMSINIFFYIRINDSRTEYTLGNKQ